MGQENTEEQQFFDDFFEEIFDEVNEKYGRIEEMNVCDNIGEHMIGNVYIKFYREEDAEHCVEKLGDRWLVLSFGILVDIFSGLGLTNGVLLEP